MQIPFFTFFSHDAGHKVKEAPWPMLLAMGTAAAFCILIGTFPDQTLYKILPFENSYNPYTAQHVVAQLQLLSFSALAFCLLLLSGIYPAEIRCVNLDFDYFYRKSLKGLYRFFDLTLNVANDRVDNFVRNRLVKVVDDILISVPNLMSKTFGILGYSKQNDHAVALRALPIGIPILLAISVLSLFLLLVL